MLENSDKRYLGNTLDFKVEGQTAFEIPLGNVSRSLTAKNEVTIEFTPNDDAAVSLVELRFHVPSDATSVADPVDVCCSYCICLATKVYGENYCVPKSSH